MKDFDPFDRSTDNLSAVSAVVVWKRAFPIRVYAPLLVLDATMWISNIAALLSQEARVSRNDGDEANATVLSNIASELVEWDVDERDTLSILPYVSIRQVFAPREIEQSDYKAHVERLRVLALPSAPGPCSVIWTADADIPTMYVVEEYSYLAANCAPDTVGKVIDAAEMQERAKQLLE